MINTLASLDGEEKDHLKTISIVFFFWIDFVYIYIYCRNFNADFNKLIKTVGHLNATRSVSCVY